MTRHISFYYAKKGEDVSKLKYKTWVRCSLCRNEWKFDVAPVLAHVRVGNTLYAHVCPQCIGKTETAIQSLFPYPAIPLVDDKGYLDEENITSV